MTHGWTAERLIAFEERVAAAFEARQVRGPIHLCSTTQAAPLLHIFESVRPEDWCFGTWRGHWMALLKGVPEAGVFQAILDGRSMFLASADHRVLCSAIVGGILPVALGVGMAIRRQESADWDNCDRTYRGRVKVFVGDMCARTGLFHEFVQYATGHALPIDVTVEDNKVSTNAVTEDTWGRCQTPLSITRYAYERDRPHTGTGKNVVFG